MQSIKKQHESVRHALNISSFKNQTQPLRNIVLPSLSTMAKNPEEDYQKKTIQFDQVQKDPSQSLLDSEIDFHHS